MLDTRLRQIFALVPALALGLPAVWADDRPKPAGSTGLRSFSHQVPAAAPATARSRETKQAPVRTVQLDSHGRYPFGQFRGGYRYPFSYPFYRYGEVRHYPYSFGVGPYGPYGSNYGGYSGNAYDPRVYGRSLPDGGPLPDAPPAPPANESALRAKAAPPADPAPRPRAAQSRPSDVAERPGPNIHAQPVPNESQAYGDPMTNLGGNFHNPTYGSARAYGAYPYGYFGENMWFGQNRLVQGFGFYPTQIYNYQYGPPNGPGYFGSEYAPQYYQFNARNYGPAYPSPGGINGGPGFYSGW